MSTSSTYRVQFVEWVLMEIFIDEATSEQDAIDQAEALWQESDEHTSIRDNGSEAWKAEKCDG